MAYCFNPKCENYVPDGKLYCPLCEKIFLNDERKNNMKAIHKARCSYCGKELMFPRDHYIEMVQKDGTTVTACHDCVIEIGKGKRDANDFMKEGETE